MRSVPYLHRWAKGNGLYKKHTESNKFELTRYFLHKICKGQLHFKALLLTGKVTAPRLKTIKFNGNVLLLFKKRYINDLSLHFSAVQYVKSNGTLHFSTS